MKKIEHLLEQCTLEQRKLIFAALRREFPIHAIEKEWNAQAEIILEAIGRSSDLSQRGVKGLIAEAAFGVDVATNLHGWRSLSFVGDLPYDYLLGDSTGEVSVQVKMQRRVKGIAMKASQKKRSLSDDLYIVEIQKTRSGKDISGRSTRPYRFGEFDIVAVCMYPSTDNWGRFMYTPSRWLVPRESSPELIAIMQVVSPIQNADWTDNFLTAVERHRSGKRRTIYPGAASGALEPETVLPDDNENLT